MKNLFDFCRIGCTNYVVADGRWPMVVVKFLIHLRSGAPAFF